MQLNHFLAISPHGFHKICYTEWGACDNPRVVVCVHGLTRNGRDFDIFARSIENEYRVICPDVVGRGKSDWLTVKSDYGYPLYIQQMGALLSHLNVEELDWIGTSMGGLIGMFLASLPGTPIRRLIMNDVGPFIPKVALDRLALYVGKDISFDTLDELEKYVRVISAPFGPLTDEEWRHLALHGSYVDSTGKYRLAYDPAIGDAFKVEQKDVDLMSIWNAVRCPVLVMHGTESDLLLQETIDKMMTRPNTETIDIPKVGHAPMLMDNKQISAIRNFLLRP